MARINSSQSGGYPNDELLGKRLLQNNDTNIFVSPQKFSHNIDPQLFSRDLVNTQQSKNSLFSNNNLSEERLNTFTSKNLASHFISLTINSPTKSSNSKQGDNSTRVYMRSRTNKRTKKASIDNINE